MIFDYCIVLFVLLAWFDHALAQNFVSKNKWCPPILPNEAKNRMLNIFRDNQGPMFIWHLQKAGGTSMCAMAMHEYKRRAELDPNYPKIVEMPFSCPSNQDFINQLILNMTHWNQTYFRKNRLYSEIEPSNKNYLSFPVKYHLEPTTQALLNPKSPLHRPAWDNVVHVLMIREPIAMALSAFTFDFPGMDRSIHGTCLRHGLKTDDCMRELFRIKDNSSIVTHDYFNVQQLNRIRSQILGNYIIHHISFNEDFR